MVWPTREDDMYVYAKEDEGYWSGYFTSRANLKSFIRLASRELHASSKLYAMRVIDKKATTVEIN